MGDHHRKHLLFLATAGYFSHHGFIIVAGMCPVLCSGHGDYEDGQCRCFPGWKGLECQLRHDQCEVADCSGHGQCVNGKCVCARGYTGPACQQSKKKNNYWSKLTDCPLGIQPRAGLHHRPHAFLGGACEVKQKKH